MKIDATEVDHPGELGSVAEHDLVGAAAGRVFQLDRLDPLGSVLRRPLLVERLPIDAVDVAFERHRPPGTRPQRAVGHRAVIAHQVDLGNARGREVELLRVGDRDVLAVDVEHLGGRGHGRTIRHRSDGGPLKSTTLIGYVISGLAAVPARFPASPSYRLDHSFTS